MNHERIRSAIDVDTMRDSHATVVGGAYGVAKDLVRCGLGAITLVDFARVSATNPSRQDLNTADIGAHKMEATAGELRRINPDVQIDVMLQDFCSLPRNDFDEQFGHTDLFVYAADSFPVSARGNLETLRLGKRAVWIGLYRAGRAGEVVFYDPSTTPACYRCVCSARYQAFRGGGAHVSSAGGTILDLHLVDSVAGHVCVGLLTHGADNRFGRLIEQLGDRNILQIKIDPEYRMGDKDLFGQYLGDHPANFSFTTIALPMERDPECPDCAHLHRETRALPCRES